MDDKTEPLEHIRYDAVAIKATLTPEGFLRDSPVIARSGVQEYRRADGTIRREWRPDEVVFDAAALSGISGIPIIDQHVGLMTSENIRQHGIGSVLSAGRQDGTNVCADIVIYDPTPVTKHGRKELSLAYAVKTEEVPGTTPDGKHYDAKVVAITRYDHLAIVQKGRAGVARLRLDADDAISTDLPESNEPASLDVNKEISAMADITQAPKLISIRIDEDDFQAEKEVVRAYDRMKRDLDAAKLRADQASAERDALKASTAKHEEDLVQIRADAAVAVRARLEIEGVAKAHSVDFSATTSDRAIREAVCKKINGDNAMKFDGESDDYVRFAFNHAVAEDEKARAQKEKNRTAINGAGNAAPRADAVTSIVPGAAIISSAEAARQAMLRRNRSV